MTTVMTGLNNAMQLTNMITAIEKPELRRKLLDASIAKQKFLINDFNERIKSLTNVEGLGNEELYDNTDIAANSVKAAEINTLNGLLEFANTELALLENLKITQDLERDHVGLGAVVETNHYIFFISASVEKFEVDGQTYVGISTQSPIYVAMENKVKGDGFTYKGIKYRIKDIF
jgi:hypothetical protein